MNDFERLDFQIKVVDGTSTLPKGAYKAKLTNSALVFRTGKQFQTEKKTSHHINFYRKTDTPTNPYTFPVPNDVV
jgi:hypothetical protein